MTTIKEVLPMIDEAIVFYQTYRSLIESIGGSLDVKNISQLIGTISGFLRR